MNNCFNDKYGNFCIVEKREGKLMISTDHGQKFRLTTSEEVRDLKNFVPVVYDEFTHDIYCVPEY